MSPTPLRPPPPVVANPFTEKEARRIVTERAMGICELAIDHVCLGRMASVHHRVKRGQGGKWCPSNLLAACGDGTRGCHGYVEAHPDWAKTKGFWCTPDQDTTDTPAHMRWMNERSWWRLDDEGMLHWAGEDFLALGPPAMPIGSAQTEFTTRNPGFR